MNVSLRTAVVLSLLLLTAAGQTVQAADELDFDRDIRPILSDKCFFCHGPDQSHREADLRLDQRDAAIELGAIVPGQPDESELVRRIFAESEDERMPPVDSRKRLTDAQKETLRQWIADGANYEIHWAYKPLVRTETPKPQDASWGHNEIDAFVLGALERRKLRPSPEADRPTLLRRLSLDLIGLPPTPEEVQAFVADQQPGAYERQVDRLLQSPHYGERMAVPWLDVVRFSDTVGYHGDQNQNIFPYRDYVIDSFNRNKPFDRFTIEQLAGDLLASPTIEQRVATGFNRLNMMTREGGAQTKEYLAKYAADRARTVAATWLGSTMGCCECHDHKYDPFQAKDFYQMAAFFADVKQWGVYSDYRYTPNPDLAGWSNDHPFPPEIEVESEYLRRRQERLWSEIEELAGSAVRQTRFSEWQQAGLKLLEQWPDGWKPAEPIVPIAKANEESEITVESDGSLLFSGKPASDKIAVRVSAGWLAAIRLEVLPHEKHGGGILRDNGRSGLVQMTATLESAEGASSRLAFYYADADYLDPRYSGTQPIIGVQGGWKTSAEYYHTPQTSVWLLAQPVELTSDATLVITLPNNPIGCLQVSVSPFVSPRVIDLELAPRLIESLSSSADPLVQLTYLISTGEDAKAFARYKELHRDWLECRDGKAMTQVTESGEPLVMRVLPRGNWQDESGEIVQPGVPHFLPQPANPEGRRLDRMDLANWLISPENPLTPRVFVNRVWKQFFGAGLANSVDDLGAQGDPPSHPKLLDWLAVDFRDHGWNVKRLVKQMVMSSAYRQSSNQSRQFQQIDPANRLLASQSPRRLEAEFVRDNLLAISGLLNREIGGPSARPYQPAGYYANLQFPDRDYVAHVDDRQYRRGVYMHWQRTFLHPMLANFDAPSREECTAARIVSNTPQQALTLLNNPSFVEAARVFAARLLVTTGRTDEDRLDEAYQRALARSASEKERKSLLRFLAEQRAHYQSQPEQAGKLLSVGLSQPRENLDSAELAAWTSVCRVIFNLHETITRY
jgi:hypothetical protein